MRMDVDGLDATATHDYLSPWYGAAGRQWGLCSIRDITADKRDIRFGAVRIFEELPMRAHSIPSGAIACCVMVPPFVGGILGARVTGSFMEPEEYQRSRETCRTTRVEKREGCLWE
jgi:hypothetical protein